MVDCVEVVLWLGRPDDGAAGIVDLDEGPIVDEFERCVWAGMSDRVIIERMSWVLDMPAHALSIHYVDRVVALGIGLDAN